jgi:hypothetical protein
VTLLSPIEKTIRNRGVAYGVIAVGTIMVIISAFLEKGNQLLPASTIAYASCFVLTVYFLRNRVSALFDAVLTAAATTFSGVWLYEVFYHYYWGTSIAALRYDFSNFSIVLYPGWAFPIYFAAVLIMLPFLKRQYISLNIPLICIFAISVAIFVIWATVGYPQYFGTTDPTVVGYWMNSISKILAIVPAFLFCEWGKINLRRSPPLPNKRWVAEPTH